MRTHMTITAPKPREHFSGASNSLEPLQSANVQDMFLLYPLAAKPTRTPSSPPSLYRSLRAPYQQLLLLHAKRCFNMKLVRSFGFWLSCVPTTSSSSDERTFYSCVYYSLYSCVCSSFIFYSSSPPLPPPAWTSPSPSALVSVRAKVKQIQIACHVLIWSTNDRTFKHTHTLAHTRIVRYRERGR